MKDLTKTEVLVSTIAEVAGQITPDAVALCQISNALTAGSYKLLLSESAAASLTPLCINIDVHAGTSALTDNAHESESQFIKSNKYFLDRTFTRLNAAGYGKFVHG